MRAMTMSAGPYLTWASECVRILRARRQGESPYSNGRAVDLGRGVRCPEGKILPVTMEPLRLKRVLTAPLRRLPDFLIIGAQKCGTTSLYQYLKHHPRISQASTKEIFFFDLRYGNGPVWYRGHFPYRWSRVKPGSITGEATPEYLFHPHAPGRIFRTTPWAKLIVLLRNPVDRAYSHYQHQVRVGRETLSFEEAIDAEPSRLDGEFERMLADERYNSPLYRNYAYLTRGIYVDHLARFTARFPKEQLLVLRSEDFYADPGAVLEQVIVFLELPSWEPGALRKYNDGGSGSRMPAATRQRLGGFFKPHNRRLAEHLGRDMGWEGVT